MRTSEEASTAEKAYGIEPREVTAINRGARTREEIFLGAAFTSGLDKVVIPFIDKGIPIEYELVRSICTVAEQKRKKLGVLKTDVQGSLEAVMNKSRSGWRSAYLVRRHMGWCSTRIKQ